MCDIKSHLIFMSLEAHLFLHRSGDVSFLGSVTSRSKKNILCPVFLGLCNFLLWMIWNSSFLFF